MSRPATAAATTATAMAAGRYQVPQVAAGQECGPCSSVKPRSFHAAWTGSRKCGGPLYARRVS